MNPLFKILIGLGILKKDLDYHPDPVWAALQ
jgi:hypothetical protein